MIIFFAGDVLANERWSCDSNKPIKIRESGYCDDCC